ncbi:hypothetical protein BGX20_001632, partial [Mortierella sp. AD010]
MEKMSKLIDKRDNPDANELKNIVPGSARLAFWPNRGPHSGNKASLRDLLIFSMKSLFVLKDKRRS